LTNEQCENCAFAKWESDCDEIYGNIGYVDECKRQFGMNYYIDKFAYDMYFEESIDGDECCPFFIPQYTPEKFLTRCPSCNSPNHKLKNIDEEYDKCTFVCEHCCNSWDGRIPYEYYW
jgi:hypothetical protein